MLQHVFISYRHESPEHARAVRRLGELLRQAAIPVALDQFYLDEFPGGPDLGWPKWCEDCANQSACVLIIGSEGWFAAYEKKAGPGVGLGAASEADLFRQSLYDGGGENSRIRLAFLHDIPAEQVPARLRAWHQYRPFGDGDQLDLLVRWIAVRLGLGKVESAAVQWPAPVAFRPDLADRAREEWPAIVNLLAGRSRQRILLYEGASGLGKSTLLRQAAEYAKVVGVPTVRVDLKGGSMDVESILGEFDLDLGTRLPNFVREGSTKPLLLRKDLRALREPVLIIFDTYEGCVGNKSVVDWLSYQLLAEVETALGLAVIVAGQEVPGSKGTGWHNVARLLRLTPITEIEHWQLWVEQHYPDFQKKGADLNTVMMFAQGNPAVVSSAVETISNL
jgi:hypothetical protein